jgi:hypothetical protein
MGLSVRTRFSCAGKLPQERITHPRCSTQIEQYFAFLQEAIFLIELYQLECGTSSVAFLLGELIPFIQTAFAMLLKLLATTTRPKIPNKGLATYLLLNRHSGPQQPEP